MVRNDIKNSSLLKTKFLIYAFNGRTQKSGRFYQGGYFYSRECITPPGIVGHRKLPERKNIRKDAAFQVSSCYFRQKCYSLNSRFSWFVPIVLNVNPFYLFTSFL